MPPRLPSRSHGRRDQLKNWQQLQPQLPKAKRYTDYREMLEKQKNIDAVVVATPDHMHAHIALAAMDLGKHVYVQKPLAWSVDECRRLASKAVASKLQTQMGNQGHSSDDARLVNEYIQSGAIGTVTEVHVWTNRPLAYWPQGVPRPAPLSGDANNLPWNMDGVMKREAAAFGSYPPPDKLAWDLFLGCARQVDYHPIYHPFNWRGWTDWGVGAIGDMGAHLIDSSFWSLDLDFPTTIETTSTPYNKDTYPSASTTYYEFAARGARPAVRMTWYDGGLTPPKPVEIGDEELNKGGGVLYIGTKGKLMHDTYGFNPRLLPKSLHDERRQAEGNLPAHQDQPRDELDRRHPWHAADHQPVRVLGAPHRDHVVRRGRAQRRQEDRVRRRRHEGEERAGLRRAAQTPVSRRVGAGLERERHREGAGARMPELLVDVLEDHAHGNAVADLARQIELVEVVPALDVVVPLALAVEHDAVVG